MILMLEKTEGKRTRGWQRMRRLESTTGSVNMNLSRLPERVEDRGAWCAVVHGVAKSRTQLNKEPGSPALQADALLSEPSVKGQTV